jgi:hypothetical protein
VLTDGGEFGGEELVDVLASVQVHVDHIVLQLPVLDASLALPLRGVLHGISVDLRARSERPPFLQQRLARFAGLARQMGLKSLATGANSLGLARAARGSGFDYVAGTAIHLTEPDPKAAGASFHWERRSRRPEHDWMNCESCSRLPI